MESRPRRIRVDLFNGPPPYDNYRKEDRVAFWLLRRHPEKKNDAYWLLDWYRREEGRRSYEGNGYENAVYTLFGELYEFAKQNWAQYQKVLAEVKRLPPNKMIQMAGHRPLSGKKLYAQLQADWARFLKGFKSRIAGDIEALKGANWPIPPPPAMPWEE